MNPASPSEQKRARNILFWRLASVVLLILGLGVWSNHFQNQFHGDDFHIVVNNHAIRSLGNIPRFFTHPHTFSAETEWADYKPLLLATFAIDAAFSNSLNPVAFQLDTFAWFAFLIFSMYLLFRMMPGTGTGIALFGTALFGLHPVAAETVNYVSQRGQIMGAAGVCLALAFWIIWPRRLPQRLGLNIDRVPQSWLQFQIRTHGWRAERGYRNFLALPLPFYLIPLIPALLAEPSAAVFVILLAVYIRIFDSAIPRSRLLPPAILCGGYWLLQTATAWWFSSIFRVSFFSWWITQPWVTLRYLYSYFLPGSISADSGFRPIGYFWPPSALAGFVGVALLVRLAMLLERRPEWRSVAFGIWWFLIALAPAALVPQRAVEANFRLLLPAVGLAFAIAHIAGILYAKLYPLAVARDLKVAATVTASVLALLMLAGIGWLTWERNTVWQTEATLWLDVTQRSPQNGLGFINYAAAMAADSDETTSLYYLQKAVPLCTDDALLQIRLGQGFNRLNRDAETELHFRKAIALAPRYSAAYSAYGQWLLIQQRLQEAFDFSRKALTLNAADLTAYRTLLEIYSQRSDWAMVTRTAHELLALDPDDPAGKRLLVIAGTSIEELHRAEAEVGKSATVNDYLNLSVLYYRSQRYEDCIKASRNALKLQPNLAEAWANIAAAEHILGRDDDAITSLSEVVRLRPDMTFARTDLEILLEKKNAQPAR